MYDQMNKGGSWASLLPRRGGVFFSNHETNLQGIENEWPLINALCCLLSSTPPPFVYFFYGSLVLIDDGFLSPFHSNSHNKDTLGRCV